jgi:TRAP-type C4-dicarboxylate transport system permease small subunit
MFERIHARLARIAQIAVWIGGGAHLAAAIMVTIDVILRKIFSITMSGSDEMSGYVFAAGTTWAYSYCVLHRSNIRIDAVYNLLPRRLCGALDIVGVVLLLIFNAVLTRHAWEAFATSYVRDSVSITTLATPLWIPQLFWVIGLIAFQLTLIFVAVYATLRYWQRDDAAVNRIVGVPTVAEEVEAETRGMAQEG